MAFENIACSTFNPKCIIFGPIGLPSIHCNYKKVSFGQINLVNT